MTGTQPGRWVLRASALLLVALLPAMAAAQPPDGPPLASANVYSGGVDFRVQADFARAIVTISGGEILFERAFEADEQPSIEPFDLEGNLLPDGVYDWQLELIPGEKAARELRIEATMSEGAPPSGWVPLVGTFSIRGGLVAAPDVGEGPQNGPDRDSSGSFGSGLPSSGFKRAVPAQDDDAAVGLQSGFEEAVREALRQAESAPAAGPEGRQLFERTDAGAAAMGGTLEPSLQPSKAPSMRGERAPAPRSISPDGKDGRPRSRDEVR